MKRRNFPMHNDKLEEWKESFEDQVIDDEKVQAAIMQGFRAAKEKQRKKRQWKKRMNWSVGLVAVLLLSFVFTMKLSPTFANWVSSFRVIDDAEFVARESKGLDAAMKNEHYQQVNRTEENDLMKITFNGFITDEKRMVIFYFFEHKLKDNSTWISNVRFLNKDGEEIPYEYSIGLPGGISRGYGGTEGREVNFFDVVPTGEMIVEFTAAKRDGSFEQTLQFPFSNHLSNIKHKVYDVNKQVEIEGQKMTIETVDIGPIKTAVTIREHDENTKKLFGIEDLQLVDQDGDSWGFESYYSREMSEKDQTVHTYFLESNFFDKPKELSLQFTKVSALNKDETFVLIDTEKMEILQQPQDQRFIKFERNNESLNHLPIEHRPLESYYLHFQNEDRFHGDYLSYRAIDANDKTIYLSGGRETNQISHKTNFKINIDDETYVNPLKLQLVGYPTYIEKEIKIELQ